MNETHTSRQNTLPRSSASRTPLYMSMKVFSNDDTEDEREAESVVLVPFRCWRSNGDARRSISEAVSAVLRFFDVIGSLLDLKILKLQFDF